MRRLSSALVVLSLVVTACAGSDSDSTDDTSAPVTDAPPVDTDAAPSTPPPTDAPAPVDTEPPATDAPADTTPSDTTPPDTGPAAPDSTPTTDAAAPAEFTAIERGPYTVGVQTITITDAARERPLTTDVWFPVADGTSGEPHRYAFITGDYYESPEAISADPTSIAPDGPFPLVAFSHGSGGVRYQTSFLTEFLSSHGYIVAAPEHTGNTAIDRIAEADTETTPEEQARNRAEIALNRVLDIQAVIDAMLNPESAETAGFVASVDPEQIAVSGHSFGGFTAYAVVSGYDNELGNANPDLRVDAILPLAPAVGDGGPDSLLSDERLASVDVPALVMVGTNDQTTPATPNVDRGFGLGASDPSYRVDLIDAQHQSFSDACDYLEFVPNLENPTPVVVEVIEQLATEGCTPGDMPIERVKELTTTFAISFLDSVFGEADTVAPDEIAIPDDVLFESK